MILFFFLNCTSSHFPFVVCIKSRGFFFFGFFLAWRSSVKALRNKKLRIWLLIYLEYLSLGTCYTSSPKTIGSVGRPNLFWFRPTHFSRACIQAQETFIQPITEEKFFTSALQSYSWMPELHPQSPAIFRKLSKDGVEEQFLPIAFTLPNLSNFPQPKR